MHARIFLSGCGSRKAQALPRRRRLATSSVGSERVFELTPLCRGRAKSASRGEQTAAERLFAGHGIVEPSGLVVHRVA